MALSKRVCFCVGYLCLTFLFVFLVQGEEVIVVVQRYLNSIQVPAEMTEVGALVPSWQLTMIRLFVGFANQTAKY